MSRVKALFDTELSNVVCTTDYYVLKRSYQVTRSLQVIRFIVPNGPMCLQPLPVLDRSKTVTC
jgi:hypothetical protein